jgi:hypothetical protein
VSAIDDLAATVRARLDAIEDDAVRGYLHAPEIPGYTRWDNSGCAGLPPAVAALVLREAEARRKLVGRLLAEPHVRTPWLCESEAGDPCDCGRDVRVAAYLTLLAEPYQETT